MRDLNAVVLSASDAVSQTSAKIDANQLFAASFQIYCSDTDAGGTVKIEYSNDPCGFGNMAASFTPTHWQAVPSATATVTAGVTTAPIVMNPFCYRWLRVVFTQTTPGTGTIVVQINAQGV